MCVGNGAYELSFLSCALHSKIINKRRLMLKTNDVRISDCSLLLHASLKSVCLPTPPSLSLTHSLHHDCLLRHPVSISPAPEHCFNFFLSYILCSRCIIELWAQYLHMGQLHCTLGMGMGTEYRFFSGFWHSLRLTLNGKTREKPFEACVAEP